MDWTSLNLVRDLGGYRASRASPLYENLILGACIPTSWFCQIGSMASSGEMGSLGAEDDSVVETLFDVE